MSTIAAALKAEIIRVSRREARSLTQALRKTTAQFRREIAALKRQVKSLESQKRRTDRRVDKHEVQDADDTRAMRFSAKGLRSHRKRLGVSAHDLGQLLGVSAQTVYSWEQQRSTPRARQMTAIAALRTMSRREALARLETPAPPSAAEG